MGSLASGFGINIHIQYNVRRNERGNFLCIWLDWLSGAALIRCTEIQNCDFKIHLFVSSIVIRRFICLFVLSPQNYSLECRIFEFLEKRFVFSKKV